METLSREDPEAAGDARAALAWLTGDEGLETISLLRLQEFLWYALPVKWPMSTPGRVGVAKALGRLFLLAGLERYAGVCSSAGTEKIITAYADGHEDGIAAYTEAIEESNAAPPDTELLAWGSVIGIAGARRLRRLRRRAGTRLRLRRAERGRPRLADQARGHRQPLAVFAPGATPPDPPGMGGLLAPPYPPRPPRPRTARRGPTPGWAGSVRSGSTRGRTAGRVSDHGWPAASSRACSSRPRSPTTRCPRCAGCSAAPTRACVSPPGTTSRPPW